MKKSTSLGNNFYLSNGVIQHKFSSVFYDIKEMRGNFTPKKWLLDRVNKLEGLLK